ncbi:MAG: hypothetical protein RRB13_01320 [bacterium]|nr:hypothetical protein [bacterium]
MKRLIQILGVHSVRELLRYKSFFLLVFLLFLADRLLKLTLGSGAKPPGLSEAKALGLDAAGFVFEQLPSLLGDWLLDGRVLLGALALFVMKQLISIWPSSDMRRMHRGERQGFGLLGSLTVLRWHQVLWDLIAVGSLSLLTLSWAVGTFVLARIWWDAQGGLAALLLWAGLLGLVAPVVLAGLSFSSKLAVLSQGSFRRKLTLYFKLFTDARFFAKAWAFYSLRTILEGIFVGLVPAGALLWIESFPLRMLVAALSATPVYSFVKMASFKFFLFLYRDYPEVKEEYARYYEELEF